MSEKIIEFRHVKKDYGDNTVIKDLSFSVEKGDFVTMIGSSGGGKTTTLKMVNALIEPTAGDILVEGTDIRDCDPVQLRRSIGYAIQGSVLFPNMTVEENIAYVPNLLNKKDKIRTAQAVDKWMKIVGLDPSMKERYPDELSGGQQQRVGIARALAASPHILLMDEPFGAVDEITRSALQDEIMRIHRETQITILFVTHDIQEALKLADKVFIMDHGEIQQYDTPTRILQHPANEFVEKLVWRERHACLLGEDRVGRCEFSRAARGMEIVESNGEA
jgi:osmoprotectant transport system ATP-binding protein